MPPLCGDPTTISLAVQKTLIEVAALIVPVACSFFYFPMNLEERLEIAIGSSLISTALILAETDCRAVRNTDVPALFALTKGNDAGSICHRASSTVN